MAASSMSTRRVSRDISEVWISSYISGVVSIFSHSYAFVQVMTDVGLPEDLGVLSSDEDQRVCEFEISVINHVLISLL